MSLLAAWANFYVIVGSSAGALTGLTFVVITLVAGRPLTSRPLPEATAGVGAYTTPTIVHFGMALFVSAMLSAPWPSLAPTAVVLGLSGLAGVGYGLVVVRRLRRGLASYEPVREDWVWYAAAPLAANTALVVAAVVLPGNPTPALFAVAAVLLLLVFMGIRNAWDVVTYLVLEFYNRTE